MKLPSVALLLFAAPFFHGFAPAADSRKPNILLIVADDLGYGETTMQGFTKDIPTPNIDSIAANGTRFTNGYVSGPYCSPTRAGLLTGRYQQRFGHEFNPGPAEQAVEEFGLPLTEKTIADRLKPAGYATGWFGKSHLGYKPQFHPLKRGFDEFFGFLGGAHDYFEIGAGANAILRGTEPAAEIDYATTAFAREAVGFIERHQKQPWFCYLPFNAVHAPLDTLEKYEKRFENIADAKRRKFAALLSALDDSIGTVLAKIRELKQEENTLIFFFSDNGGPTASITSGNGSLRGFKSQTWEGGIRVPFCVQWKGTLPAGKIEARPVIQLDVLPTILAAAGIEAQADWKLDGVNLLPYLKGEKTEAPHESLYWRLGNQIAIRKGDWKLVKGAGGKALSGAAAGNKATAGAELYNLANDIGEKTDLAEKEPEKFKELAAQFEKWNGEVMAPKWTGRTQPRAQARNAKSNASPKGPWKSGDVLESADAPQIAGKGLEISAEVETTAANGVIVAQGAGAHGFSFYLEEGKLAFSVRAARNLTTATAKEALPPGKHQVGAKLSADGTVTFSVDGKEAGAGKVSGAVRQQPGEGLSVGSDGRGAVGEYTAPNELKGSVQNVSVRVP